MKKEEKYGNPDPLLDGFLVHYLTADHKTQHQEMNHIENGWGTTVQEDKVKNVVETYRVMGDHCCCLRDKSPSIHKPFIPP